MMRSFVSRSGAAVGATSALRRPASVMVAAVSPVAVAHIKMRFCSTTSTTSTTSPQAAKESATPPPPPQTRKTETKPTAASPATVAPPASTPITPEKPESTTTTSSTKTEKAIPTPTVTATPTPSEEPIPAKTQESDSKAAAAEEAAAAVTAAEQAQEILQALRSRNFTEIQGKTQELVASHWQDDYAIPLACILCFLVTWYWQASSYRRIARNLRKQEAKAIEDAKAVEDKVVEIATRLSKNMANRSISALEVQKQNSELTRVIDQMTTALKQCPPRG